MKVLITESQYLNITSSHPVFLQDNSGVIMLSEDWIDDIVDFIYEYRHGIIDVAAIGALFIPVAGPLISLGLELSNAALYAYEGDKYSAGLGMAFSLIPGGQLVRRIPSVKRLGTQGLKSLLKKARNPKAVKTLSKTEKEALEQINKNSKWITLTAAKELSRKIAKLSIEKMRLPQIVNFVHKFSIKYPKIYNTTKMGLTIGGIWYSYDKLAKMFGIKDRGVEMIPKSKKPSVNPTIYKTQGDPYQYKFENGQWYTKSLEQRGTIISDWKSLKDNKKATDILNNRFPEASEQYSTKKLEDLFETDKEREMMEIIGDLTINLTDEDKNKAFQMAAESELKNNE